ncbi:MAG: hypothetical protein IPK82_36570 [Polyangiaceae bacterium]|nr:hypothetical protein [Polyangiaceae bacterium]
MRRWISGLACVVSALLSAGCSGPKDSPPQKDPPPALTASVTAAVINAPPQKTAAPLEEIPTLAPKEVKFDGGKVAGPYPIKGAIMVSSGIEVGRLVGDKVEWIGRIPAERRWGPTYITNVYGQYPDAVDVLYQNVNGRVGEPTLMALTGKGKEIMLSEGGGFGDINGVIRLGESTLVAYRTMTTRFSFSHMRGPFVKRTPTSVEKMGCTKEEMEWTYAQPQDPAMVGKVVAATTGGTVVSFGNLCEKRGAAAEIWDKNGTAKIVELKQWIKEVEYSPTLIVGQDDDLYFHNKGKDPILRFKDGKFETVAPPSPGQPLELMASQEGKLHANSAGMLYRMEGGKWVPIAKFAWPTWLGRTAIDGETIWVDGMSRLEKRAPIDLTDVCTTPFVFLYDVSAQNQKNFTFPSTRKALQSFAQASEIQLVDFEEESRRRLGVVVKTKAQADAVVAHVRATMKDENPRPICFAPTNPRVIDLNAKP